MAASGLYDQIVPGFASLPAVVRRLHEPGRARGTFDVSWGEGFWARQMARLMRLPPPNASTSVELQLSQDEGIDVWARSFDGVRLVCDYRV